MDLQFTAEQTLLRESVSRFLHDHHLSGSGDALTKLHAGAGLWKQFGETLGILGAGLQEKAGGMGGGAVETMIIMEELGSALVIEPYLETAVICGALLSRSEGSAAHDLLQRIIAGTARVAFAHDEGGVCQSLNNVTTRATHDADGWVINGEKTVVVAAPGSDQILISARTHGADDDREGISLFVVDRVTTGLQTHDYTLIDDRPAADLMFTNLRVREDAMLGSEGTALGSIENAIDRGIAALCSEAVGVMRRLLADTIEHTRQRTQFGSPLSKFQVLQHRMVDMYIALERAISATCLVTLKLDADAPERALAVAAAKATICETIRFVAQNAVQLHGAMGMTDELAVGHYFRRATVIEHQFGSADYHIARYSELKRNALLAA